MGVLMNITAKMSHEYAFFVTAVISALLVLPLFFMIIEPRKMPALQRKNSDPEILTTEENQSSSGGSPYREERPDYVA